MAKKLKPEEEIQKVQDHIVQLEERIGRLMSQRAIAQERLADLITKYRPPRIAEHLRRDPEE